LKILDREVSTGTIADRRSMLLDRLSHSHGKISQMSSLIGHSLAGLTAAAVGQKLQQNSPAYGCWQDRLWTIVLIAIASVPDIDYLIPALRLQQSDRTLRITHSVIGVLLLPTGITLLLWLCGSRGRSFKLKSIQLILTGLSHLLFDLLTGVFPEPLLYPFSTHTFRLPFGLLPSAGKIQLTNYLFYRNLSIELGVLLPLLISLYLSIGNPVKSYRRRLTIAICLLVSGYFMLWAASLSR
jgi:inner membrane protein